MQYSLYIVHCTLYSVHCTVYTALYSVQYCLYIQQNKLMQYTAHCTTLVYKYINSGINGIKCLKHLLHVNVPSILILIYNVYSRTYSTVFERSNHGYLYVRIIYPHYRHFIHISLHNRSQIRYSISNKPLLLRSILKMTLHSIFLLILYNNQKPNDIVENNFYL